MFGFSKKTNGYQVKPDNKYTLEKERLGLKKYKEILNDINTYGYISEELGRELENLFNDVGYIGSGLNFTHLGYEIGIHLTGYSPINEEYIETCFNNGLINNGHSMHGGGMNNFAPSIDLTTTPMDSVPFTVNHLKKGHSYKGSEGAVIIKYPHELKGDNEKLQYFDGIAYRILPNYVYGIVLLKENGIVGDLIKNPNFNLEVEIERK